jgi:hypothetical protein
VCLVFVIRYVIIRFFCAFITLLVEYMRDNGEGDIRQINATLDAILVIINCSQVRPPTGPICPCEEADMMTADTSSPLRTEETVNRLMTIFCLYSCLLFFSQELMNTDSSPSWGTDTSPALH